MTAVATADFPTMIQRHFSQRRNAAKVLARMSGATERAAKNWLAGRNVPQAEHVIRLMAECEELESEVLRLVREIRGDRT